MATEKYNTAQKQMVVRVHAQANKSDPHSYGRIMLHMSNGLADPKETLEDAMEVLKARGEKWWM